MSSPSFYVYPHRGGKTQASNHQLPPHLPPTCKHIWVRAEVKSKPPRGHKYEIGVDARSPLSPEDCRTLVEHGMTVSVEASPSRVFPDHHYQQAGCQLVSAGSWVNAPLDAAILGIRDFEIEPSQSLLHRHLFFSHCLKKQPGWQLSLARFVRGGGRVLDLEFLLDDFGQRIASYGVTAGLVAMASGVLAWCRQALKDKVVPGLLDQSQALPLLDHVKELLRVLGRTPKIIVIGATGRAGSGALDFAEALGLPVTGWDSSDTRRGGPFPELLQFDILVHAIRLSAFEESTPPFLTRELVRHPNRRLSVIVDVACDLKSRHNKMPLHTECTTFERPVQRLLPASSSSPPLDVVAIPNLPSLLPAESSRFFSKQLLPALLLLPERGWASPVWSRCCQIFSAVTRPIRPLHVPSMPLLASSSDEERGGEGEGADTRIVGRVVAPLTAAQRRLLRGGSSTDGGGGSTKAILVRDAIVVSLDRALHVRRMQRAVMHVVQLHSLLHSHLVPHGMLERPLLGLDTYVTVLGEQQGAMKRLNRVLGQLPAAGTVSSAAAHVEGDIDPGRGRNLHVTVTKQGERTILLSCVMHPLVGDAHSVRLFLHQVLIAYQSGIHSLAHPQLQHSDYSRWLERLLDSNEANVLGQHSLDQYATLDDTAAVLQAPTDFSRTSDGSHRCLRETLPLSADENQAVRALKTQLDNRLKTAGFAWAGRAGGGWVLYSLFLTVFSIQLYRRTREADQVVTSQSSGRALHPLRGLLGPLSSQMHVRLAIEEKLTFWDLFCMVRAAVVRATNADVPFLTAAEQLSSLGKWKRLTDDLGDASLSTAFSNILFNLSPALLASDDPAVAVPPLPAGLGVAESPSSATASRSPMELGLLVSSIGYQGVLDWQQQGPFQLHADYRANLFRAEGMQEMLRQLGILLVQVAGNMDQGIMTYNLVTPESKALLPVPSAPLDYGWPGPITACFDTVAQRVADDVAVSYKDEIVSYRQLRRLTNRLAHAIHNAGVGKGDVVAIYGHRSPAVVWAIMGILKSGAAYCMCDPKYPPERINIMLDIAKVKGWIRIEAAGTAPPAVCTHLDQLKLPFREVLPATASFPNGEPGASDIFGQLEAEMPPQVTIDEHTVAVITFTSGSTGLPKGVMGRHVSLTHFYPWMATRFSISAKDKFSMCSGIAHDPLQRDIFTPLFFGASVAIPTDSDIVEPGALARWFLKHDITIACMTPAMGQLLTSGEDHSFSLDKFRWAFFVGDMLIKKNVELLRSMAPSLSVINMYGSTETQRAVGYLELPASADLSRMKEVIAVGVGMKDSQMVLLNAAGVVAGVGELAEIYVRSPHMAQGYVGLDDKTASVFLPNPFNKGSGVPVGLDRMYRTGDLGRYTSDGDVECAGRADDQVKIRGFRIELGEINGSLSKHPFVKANITLLRTLQGQKEIVSFVTLGEKARTELGPVANPQKVGQLLRDFVREILPSYMVPAAVVVLTSMPLTPNGKVNRKALKAMVIEKGTGAGSSRLLTPVEQLLLDTWAKVLRVSNPGVTDTFFNLGGDSLLATQLTGAMNKVLPPELAAGLEIKLLLAHPTVEKLAAALLNKASGSDLEEDKFDLAAELESVLEHELTSVVDPLTEDYVFQTPQAVFVTGGNGFLGSFLVAELLQNSQAKVICGVRGRSKAQAEAKLFERLSAVGVLVGNFRSRLEVVPCDLTKPLLGLDRTFFVALSDRIDTILHCGAMVHWLLPYSSLKAANVNGTIEVLRLAGHGRRKKAVHYVSTTSTLDDPAHESLPLVMEDDPMSSVNGQKLQGGYPQSKWVAEKLCMAARQWGIPTSIYRPGYICGDSRHGQWVTDDFLCRLIKGCIELKAYPFPEPTNGYVPMVDMAPVDYVAKTICTALTQSSSLNKGFHTTNPTMYPFHRMFARIRSFGFDIEAMPYAEWRARLQTALGEGADNALTAIAAQFSTTWINGLSHAPYSLANVLASNRAANVVCPNVDELMNVYISYLVGCEFLDPPEREAETQIDWAMIKQGVKLLTRTNRAGAKHT